MHSLRYGSKRSAVWVFACALDVCGVLWARTQMDSWVFWPCSKIAKSNGTGHGYSLHVESLHALAPGHRVCTVVRCDLSEHPYQLSYTHDDLDTVSVTEIV